MQKKELITVQTTDLSAREFVVYQYGLSVLHLLITQLHVSLLSSLCEAVTRAAEESRGQEEALRSGSSQG